jgi:lipopolysaccharide export system permease protein
MGEYVAPAGDQMAQQFRNEQVSQGKATSASNAIWLRDGDVILRTNHMAELALKGTYELKDVTVFALKDKKLTQVSDAESATFENNHWTLKNLKVSTFSDTGVKTSMVEQQQWESRIQPEILNISTTRPKYLSIRDIKKFQQFSAKTGSLQSAYHIAWWSKMTFPLLVIATGLCGIVMLFGQIRSSGFAQRLVVGIVIGVVVYLLNKTLLNYGEVYHVHPFWVTLLPSMMLTVSLLWVLSGKRIR